MSWGERSCSKENAPKNYAGGCDVATCGTCNVDCEFYSWDGKTKPDSVSKKQRPLGPLTQKRTIAKVGRNDPCPCGSGRKFKKCCGH